jgi:hypothetical protein
LPHFKNVLSLHDIEPLVLVVVEVATRTTPGMMRHLHYQQITVTILRRDLEEDSGDPTAKVLTESINIPRNPELLHRCI